MDSARDADIRPEVVVIISAHAEWRAARELLPGGEPAMAPYGGWVAGALNAGARTVPVVYLHGGWGKIAAAASAQYAIDRWAPRLLVNLGTCGGFAGGIERGTIVLAERTVVYDILEQMGDPDEAIAEYATTLDLSWLTPPLPQTVQRGLLISGDRDLVRAEVAGLRARYGAVAGDWESGAIAFVAARNRVRCLILRGVTDLVGAESAEAYGNYALFEERTATVMRELLEALPGWVVCAGMDRGPAR